MMEDDYHKTGIYRWQRQTKPSRVQSRTQKVTTTNDIQHWLQKVEEASTKAAEAVLGPELSSASPYTIGRHCGQATIRGASDQARIQDEAYTEAQDLLSEWLTQKVTLHDNDLEPDLEGGDPDPVPDPWRREDLGSKARREWDNLLNGNLEELGMDTAVPWASGTQQKEEDPYANLYDLDEGEAVSAVMKNMMSKDLVKERFRKDLGFDDPLKGHDPRTMMALRHQRVKENREKREEELRRKRREQDTKKQARLTAQKIVMKEQKEKEMKKRKEEQEIKKQMAHIRKEMHQARKQETEEKLRKHQEEEETVRLAHEELARQQAMETEEMLRKQHEASQRKQAEMAQMQLIKAKQVAENLRILHRHFTAWYDIVLYRRLCFGKARALADWRLTLRVWNAWRSHTRSQRVSLETKQHQMNVVDENRKAVKAQRHHYLRQLRRHFQAWRDFVSQEQDKRELEKAQETTRSKMLNLLTAVTQEAMKTQDKMSNHQPPPPPPPRGNPRRAWGENDDDHHNHHQSEASSLPPSSSSRPDSALSSVSGQGHQGQRAPSQGWQITRKHAHLSKEELVKFMQHGDAEDVEDGGSEVSSAWSSQHSDAKIRKRFGTQPWMKRHYVVNNLEHRFSAQQKLLKEQQSALKQQQRMIQELTFAKNQQQHRQTLAQISAALTAGQPLPSDVAALAMDSDGAGDRHRSNTSQDKPVSGGSGSPKVVSSDTKATHKGPDTHRSEVSSLVSEPSPTEVTAASSATTTGTQNTKYLRVLKNMEDRAAERCRLKAEREEKRRKAEEERLEKLKAEEEELKRQAEEEKQARVQAYREKKRLEKQKEQEKQREAERQKELNAMADVHYKRALMKFRVLVPMKKLVTMAHHSMETARQHHHHCILRKAVVAWKQHTDELTAEKKQLADDLHGYIVVRRCFLSWKNFKYRMLFMERRAERHHRDVLLPKLMEAWRQYTLMEKQEEKLRMQQAIDFYPRSLVKKVFRAWRRLPQELKREAEREKRKAEMRKKVADLLPDFTPSSPQVIRSTDSTNWP